MGPGVVDEPSWVGLQYPHNQLVTYLPGHLLLLWAHFGVVNNISTGSGTLDRDTALKLIIFGTLYNKKKIICACSGDVLRVICI